MAQSHRLASLHFHANPMAACATEARGGNTTGHLSHCKTRFFSLYALGCFLSFSLVKGVSCVARAVGSSPKPQPAPVECRWRLQPLVGLTSIPLQTKPEQFFRFVIWKRWNFKVRNKPHCLKPFPGHVAWTWCLLINLVFYSVCHLHYHV